MTIMTINRPLQTEIFKIMASLLIIPPPHPSCLLLFLLSPPCQVKVESDQQNGSDETLKKPICDLSVIVLMIKGPFFIYVSHKLKPEQYQQQGYKTQNKYFTDGAVNQVKPNENRFAIRGFPCLRRLARCGVGIQFFQQSAIFNDFEKKAPKDEVGKRGGKVSLGICTSRAPVSL